MFLRSIGILHERIGAREIKDTYKATGETRIRYRGGRVVKFGPGHIFWHPDEKRAKHLLEIGTGPNPKNRPIVDAPTEKQILEYVHSCVKGLYNADGTVKRAPIALSSLDAKVQEFYKKNVAKLEAEQAVKTANRPPATEEEATARATGTIEGSEDEPADSTPAAPKKSGKKSGKKARK